MSRNRPLFLVGGVIGWTMTACFDPGNIDSPKPEADGGVVSLVDAGGDNTGGGNTGGGNTGGGNTGGGNTGGGNTGGGNTGGGNTGGGNTGSGPQILEFQAMPDVVPLLGESTLSWSTANASFCELSPDIGPVAVEGTVAVAAASTPSTTTYTLRCTAGLEAVEDTVTVRTEFVTRTGDVTVSNAAELSALAGVNVVTGSLTLQTMTGVTTLESLAGLVTVDGSLMIQDNASLTRVDLPSLQSVGNDLVINHNVALQNLVAPSLSRVGDRFYVSRNTPLPAAQVQALVTQLQSRQGIGGAVLTYANDVGAILSAAAQSFHCQSNDDGAFTLYIGNGEVYLDRHENDATYPAASGTYTTSATGITLNLNDGITAYPPETSTAVEVEYDHIVAFTTPFFSLCHAIATGAGDGYATTRQFNCPSIRYIPDIGFEQNRFWFHADGQVEWLRTEALTGNVNNEIYHRTYGIYVFDDDRIHMAFGDNFNYLRYLSATVNGAGTTLLVDELEPERGACTLQ